MENPFVLEKSQYKRDLNLIRGYFDQQAWTLSRMFDKPESETRNFLKRLLSKGGKLPITDPNMSILRQESPGNRVRDEMTLLSYINEVTSTDRILSPSMVCYENPNVLKSPSAKFVEKGITGRKKAKSEAFKAKVANDHVLEKIKDAEQNAKKIAINSLSGMHGFSGNILFVKSGHSSLTSMCRSATGYGNAGNEKLLAGSRHYHTPEITISNIAALVTSQPHDVFEAAMQEWGLRHPTVEETAACIRRSTDLYWRGAEAFTVIGELISKMTPLERSIVVYTGDLYHIVQYNQEAVMPFFDKIIKHDPEPDPIVEDPLGYLGSINGDVKVLATYINAEYTRGEDFDSLKEKGMDDVIQRVAKTARNINNVITEYFTFIRVFLTPVLLAPSVANIKGIVRRVVLGSDTDSTIFTTQDWVEWYTGTTHRTQHGDGMWYLMTFISCQCIVHTLAQLSKNMGVVPEELHRLTMKNEYAFPVFVLTSRAKHYYAFMSCREGNVYDEYAMEIKGVALRSSVVPVGIIKAARAMMKEVMTRADQGKQFTLRELYDTVWKLENDIFTSVSKGEYRYLKTAQIQESYPNMNKDNPFLDKSNYRHYHRWEFLFAPDYGHVDTPPLTVIKVPLSINNKTDMTNWLSLLDTINPEFANRLREYMERSETKLIATLMLPHSILAGSGIPKEVMPVVDVRRMTYEILESFYMILESLGVFQVDENYVRLVSDIHTPDGEHNLMPVATEANSALEPDDWIVDDDDEDENGLWISEW